MSEPEAIGEAVSEAGLARPVEPKASEVGADGHTLESACLNCNAPLEGNFCSNCGQRAHVHRTLAAFAHDLLQGVFHLDGKVWRTVPMLVWRPGQLTRRYIDGERAKFVSPIALFLFAVFMMFAVGGITGGLGPAITGSQDRADIASEIAEKEAAVQILGKQRDAAVRANRPTAVIDSQIDRLQSEAAVLRGLTTGDFVPIRSKVEMDNLPGWLSVPIERAVRNPELLFYKLQTNAYKYSWALIPLSVPFVWLLFPFSRRFRMYDHTVFVTYSLCFMSFLMVAGMLLGSAGLGAVAGMLFLIPPIHFYRQLKGTYALSRMGALWRAALLTVLAFVAGGLFVIAVAGLGIAA